MSPSLLPDPPLSLFQALPASGESGSRARRAFFRDQEPCSAPILFLLLAGRSAPFRAESEGAVCTPSSPRSGACSGLDFIPSTPLGMFFGGHQGTLLSSPSGPSAILLHLRAPSAVNRFVKPFPLPASVTPLPSPRSASPRLLLCLLNHLFVWMLSVCPALRPLSGTLFLFPSSTCWGGELSLPGLQIP